MATGGVHDKMRPNQLETGFRVRIEAGSERLCTDSAPLKIGYSPLFSNVSRVSGCF